MPVSPPALSSPQDLCLLQSFVIEISRGTEGNTAIVSTIFITFAGTDGGTPQHESAGDKKTGTSSSTAAHYTLV